MRLMRWLIALLCLAVGVVVGALNPQPVSLDLGLATLHPTLGVCVLLALLLGVIAGGLVLVVSTVLPLRQRLRREARARQVPPSAGMPE
ncbi:MAG TPA: LapA family protein [Luteimonas sp.]|nr:LapA family protein [Luteimonas sp.]